MMDNQIYKVFVWRISICGKMQKSPVIWFYIATHNVSPFTLVGYNNQQMLY